MFVVVVVVMVVVVVVVVCVCVGWGVFVGLGGQVFRAYRVVTWVIFICKSFCIPQISDQYNNIVLIVSHIYIKCSENTAQFP